MPPFQGVLPNILTIQQKLNLEKAKKACDGSIFCEGWQEQKADWKSKQQDALIGKAKLQCAAFGDCGDIERWDKLFEDSMYYPAVVNQVRSVYPNLNDQQVYQIADEYIKESREEYSGFTRRAIANVIVMATSRGKNASAIRTTGGGKNAQHASEAAREAAKVKLDAAQAQMAQAKANGATKKEKAEIQRQIDHWRNKYQNSGENHSMKPKGNR